MHRKAVRHRTIRDCVSSAAAVRSLLLRKLVSHLMLQNFANGIAWKVIRKSFGESRDLIPDDDKKGSQRDRHSSIAAANTYPPSTINCLAGAR